MKGLIHIVIVLAGLVAIAAFGGCTPRYDGHLLAGASPVSAQLIIKNNGHAEIGAVYPASF